MDGKMAEKSFGSLGLYELTDSEIRTYDGASQDDFSEQNRSWKNSGTIISET